MADEGEHWEAECILDENRQKKLYCVAWTGTDPDTDKPYPPSWEPYNFVTKGLRDEWNAQKKAKRDAAARERKAAKLKVKLEVKEEAPDEEDEDVKPDISDRVRGTGVEPDPLLVVRDGLPDEVLDSVDRSKWEVPPCPESDTEYESEDDASGLEDVARSDDEFLPDDLARDAAKRLLPVELPFIAQVVDEDDAPLARPSESLERVSATDASALSKIKRALGLANHSGTNEMEAKQAFRMASQLMAKVNLSMADILASESEEEKDKRAGETIVRITPREGTKVLFLDWMRTCRSAVKDAFLVKAYKSVSYHGGQVLDLHFYGLATNAAAAASAYEMVQNLILEMSLRRTDLKGQVGFNSYRRGVARGLLESAREERKREEQDAEELEQRLIAASDAQAEKARVDELARLAGPSSRLYSSAESSTLPTPKPPTPTSSIPPAPPLSPFAAEESDSAWLRREAPIVNATAPKGTKTYTTTFDSDSDLTDPDSDSDSDGDEGAPSPAASASGGGGGSDWAPNPSPAPLSRSASPRSPSSFAPRPPSPPHEDATATWTSPGQLALFRSTADAIADSFIKSQGVKLRKHKGRKRKALKYDSKAYKAGKEDAKKIDLKRKRIDEARGGKRAKKEGGFVLKTGKKVVKEEFGDGGSEEASEKGYNSEEGDGEDGGDHW